ncbi:MAG: ABC transporter ATP-binding protein [Chloroflexi bacterium]|nr:ABC transporter ATP-binding protein [Chloroflexota bacterium]
MESRAPRVSAGQGGAVASPLLEVEDLKTWFYTPDGVVKAVNGVSYTLNQGEALGLVGESGCGKSVSALSLMRLIPTPPGKIVNGKVLFEGTDLLTISDEDIRRIRGNDIAMIFQDPMTSLNPVLTVGRQISEALELHKGLSRKDARERTIQLLELVGIPSARSRVDDYPHQFSGGMRQRVMIAMALSCEPKILLADEPTTALDVTIQAQILDLIKRLREELGMAVVMITHDLGVVAGIADRINVMYAGYIVESGTADDVFHTPRHPYTLGLLRSIPRVDEVREKLIPIEGLPPDLIDTPPGCPFQPRCPYAIDRCQQENPSLEPVSLGHTIACWVDVTGGEG